MVIMFLKHRSQMKPKYVPHMPQTTKHHTKHQPIKDMSLKSEETSASSDVFVEIRKPHVEKRPRTITAFMMSIEPKQCSRIVKQLAQELPLPESLAHLKRVRNPQKMKQQDETTTDES